MTSNDLISLRLRSQSTNLLLADFCFFRVFLAFFELTYSLFIGRSSARSVSVSSPVAAALFTFTAAGTTSMRPSPWDDPPPIGPGSAAPIGCAPSGLGSVSVLSVNKQKHMLVVAYSCHTSKSIYLLASVGFHSTKSINQFTIDKPSSASWQPLSVNNKNVNNRKIMQQYTDQMWQLLTIILPHHVFIKNQLKIHLFHGKCLENWEGWKLHLFLSWRNKCSKM